MSATAAASPPLPVREEGSEASIASPTAPVEQGVAQADRNQVLGADGKKRNGTFRYQRKGRE